MAGGDEETADQFGDGAAVVVGGEGDGLGVVAVEQLVFGAGGVASAMPPGRVGAAVSSPGRTGGCAQVSRSVQSTATAVVACF